MINLPLLAFSATCAFIISVSLVPLILKIAHRFKWYDQPDERKTHSGLIPQLGGIGIITAAVLSVSLTFIIAILLFSKRGNILASGWLIRLIWLAAGSLVLHILGLMDDIFNLRARFRLIIQFAVAIAISMSGLNLAYLCIPLGGTIKLGIVSHLITVLWIVGIVNAMNFCDGVDGYVGGIAGMAALFMAVIACLQGQFISAIIALSVFGAVCGFLIYNFPPAKIFMGDSGAYFLGFILAVLPLVQFSESTSLSAVITPLLLLFIPILDITFSVFRRIRAGKSPMSADRGHIHYRLLDSGLAKRKIVAIIYSFCFLLGAVSIIFISLRDRERIFFLVSIAMLIAAAAILVRHTVLRKTDDKNH